jgi:hypothetical protein
MLIPGLFVHPSCLPNLEGEKKRGDQGIRMQGSNVQESGVYRMPGRQWLTFMELKKSMQRTRKKGTSRQKNSI